MTPSASDGGHRRLAIRSCRRDVEEILRRLSDWAGGPAQVTAWYRTEPIPAFGGRTADALVKSGQAAALRAYLDSIALGGFA